MNQTENSDKGFSEMEKIKEECAFLRGNLKESLARDSVSFGKEEAQIIKFHGAYQQDNRDLRRQLKSENKEPAYSLMVRTKIPGGMLRYAQYLAHDELSNNYGDKTLRITTRQDMQLHGVLKKDLKVVLQSFAKASITTYGAGRDLVRNVVMCPSYSLLPEYHELRQIALQLTDQFLPKSNAHREIFEESETANVDRNENQEIIYRDSYLPRKFKIAICSHKENCVDVLTHDLGIIPDYIDKNIRGFYLYVGGGQGMTLGNPRTYPRIASYFGYLDRKDLHSTVKGVVEIFRDYGNRCDRKRARLKYLIDERGIEWMRNELEKRTSIKVVLRKNIEIQRPHLHLGWEEIEKQKWNFGLPILCGRIKDEGQIRMKSAIRDIVERFKVDVVLTPQQNLIFASFKESEKAHVEEILKEKGVLENMSWTKLRTKLIACPSLPMCGLAVTEAERAVPQILKIIEREMQCLGLEEKEIDLRITGCPNGCARPYLAEIGLIGRAPQIYDVRVGGSELGSRINFIISERVNIVKIANTINPLLRSFSKKCMKDESFGDYCARIGDDSIREIIELSKKNSPKT